VPTPLLNIVAQVRTWFSRSQPVALSTPLASTQMASPMPEHRRAWSNTIRRCGRLNSDAGKKMWCGPVGLAEFERDLITERVTSGLASARARGVKLGRQSETARSGCGT
jgi:hypothetical protein